MARGQCGRPCLRCAEFSVKMLLPLPGPRSQFSRREEKKRRETMETNLDTDGKRNSAYCPAVLWSHTHQAVSCDLLRDSRPRRRAPETQGRQQMINLWLTLSMQVHFPGILLFKKKKQTPPLITPKKNKKSQTSRIPNRSRIISLLRSRLDCYQHLFSQP